MRAACRQQCASPSSSAPSSTVASAPSSTVASATSSTVANATSSTVANARIAEQHWQRAYEFLRPRRVLFSAVVRKQHGLCPELKSDDRADAIHRPAWALPCACSSH
jgi:hypothetical protein